MDERNELMRTGADDVMTAAMNAAIREVVSPFMASLAEMMKQNVEALQYVAAQQKLQAERMEALERQVRLGTPLTPAQVKLLNGAIRKRAGEILTKKGIDDKRATTKLAGAIRKAVITRYGTAGLNEIPKHEYSVAMQQVETWNDIMAIHAIAREARQRQEATDPAAEEA